MTEFKERPKGPEPVGEMDVASSTIKKVKGKHYRFIREDPVNLSRKRVQGYEPVRHGDPEVIGSALEKRADGTVRYGKLILARTSEEQHQRHQAAVQGRTDKKLRSIRRSFLEKGEKVSRALKDRGNKDVEFFVKEE